MQLNKIALYHRALSDMTRLKIVFLLKDGELHGQALAEQLQVSAPTITHHMAKLREASLVESRRDKNTIYFKLLDLQFIEYAKASMRLIEQSANLSIVDERYVENNAEYVDEGNKHLKFVQAVLRSYFTAEGKLKHMPAKYKKKLIVLEKMIQSFNLGQIYLEEEVNDIIRLFYDDVATIRREFIMQQFMSREFDKYEVNPKQLWVKWQKL